MHSKPSPIPDDVWAAIDAYVPKTPSPDEEREFQARMAEMKLRLAAEQALKAARHDLRVAKRRENQNSAKFAKLGAPSPVEAAKAREIYSNWEWSWIRKPVKDFILVGTLGYECAYCGDHLTSPTARIIEHVWPLHIDGPDEEWNCVVACQRCNLAKANYWPWGRRPMIAASAFGVPLKDASHLTFLGEFEFFFESPHSADRKALRARMRLLKAIYESPEVAADLCGAHPRGR